jgi:hypothetical protein
MIRKTSILGLAAACVLATGAHAQELSPTQTYQDYRQAYLIGETYEDISGFLAPELVDSVAEDEKAMVFGFVQSMVQDNQDIQFLTETIDGDTAKVTAELCMDATMTGVYVDLVSLDGV